MYDSVFTKFNKLGYLLLDVIQRFSSKLDSRPYNLWIGDVTTLTGTEALKVPNKESNINFFGHILSSEQMNEFLEFLKFWLRFY